MAAINFPTSPSVNDIHSENGRTWVFDGVTWLTRYQSFSGFSGISGFSGVGTSGFSGYSGFSGIGASGFSGYSSSVQGTSGFSGAGTIDLIGLVVALQMNTALN